MTEYRIVNNDEWFETLTDQDWVNTNLSAEIKQEIDYFCEKGLVDDNDYWS